MADGATGETRPRTHTEKGLEYHLDRKSKYRRGCENKLVSLSEDIEELLTTSTDVNEVKELYKKWLKVYDELLFTHESLQGLLKLSTGSGESDDKEFQDRNSRFHKLLKTHFLLVDNDQVVEYSVAGTLCDHVTGTIDSTTVYVKAFCLASMKKQRYQVYLCITNTGITNKVDFAYCQCPIG
uniref:Uncharacterized protein n=1 Tax=Magallana gigas TaxID=29159 RepID=K1QYB1_MAGGI